MPTAIDLARAVRAGDLDPVSIAVDALARICSGDAAFGAFRRVRREEAVVEARALKERSDLAELALAGVPIAVKDVTAVAGETPGGPRPPDRSPATPTATSSLGCVPPVR
jgi:amidase